MRFTMPRWMLPSSGGSSLAGPPPPPPPPAGARAWVGCVQAQGSAPARVWTVAGAWRRGCCASVPRSWVAACPYAMCRSGGRRPRPAAAAAAPRARLRTPAGGRQLAGRVEVGSCRLVDHAHAAVDFDHASRVGVRRQNLDENGGAALKQELRGEGEGRAE